MSTKIFNDLPFRIQKMGIISGHVGAILARSQVDLGAFPARSGRDPDAILVCVKSDL